MKNITTVSCHSFILTADEVRAAMVGDVVIWRDGGGCGDLA